MTLIARAIFLLGVGADRDLPAAHARFVDGEFRGKLRHLRTNLLFEFGITDVREHVGDPVADFFHFRLAHAACGDGRAAEANAACFHRGQWIEGNGILVHGDAGAVERFFGVGAGDAARMNFDEKKMIVGAAGDDAESALSNGRGHGFGVGDDLFLIFGEAGFGCFLEADSFGSDGVDERSTLQAGERQLVEFFGELRAAHDEAAARAAQSLVRGGADEIGVRYRARVNACGDESGDVGHVHEEERAVIASGFCDAREIDDAGIGAGAGYDHFGFVLGGEAVDFVVVDLLGVLANAVSDEFVHAAGEIEWVAVCEVAAVREVHAEDGVAGLERGHVNGDVGLRAGVRLHVGVLGAEERLGAIDGELFGFVRDFAAAVIALAWIAFRIFVGEDRTHRFENGFRDEIFRRDEFEAGSLALGLFAQQLSDLRVNGVERTLHAVVGGGHRVEVLRENEICGFHSTERKWRVASVEQEEAATFRSKMEIVERGYTRVLQQRVRKRLKRNEMSGANVQKSEARVRKRQRTKKIAIARVRKWLKTKSRDVRGVAEAAEYRAIRPAIADRDHSERGFARSTYHKC